MIKHVKIRNYKSVQSLDLDCKRYNVFVGDTSTGKSNILEAMSLLSEGVSQAGPLEDIVRTVDKRVVRYDRLSELFTNADVRGPISVKVDETGLVVEFDSKEQLMKFLYSNGDTQIWRSNYKVTGEFVQGGGTTMPHSVVLRRYQYDAATGSTPSSSSHLMPPDGNNLSAVLLNNPELLGEIDEIMSAKGIYISIDRDTYRITQRIDITRNVAVHLSWATISETIKRYVFLYTAIRTSQSAVLLLDEPEQNTFPFYTAHIAEIMARETSNQYFITTHNQYLLNALLDKAPADEIQVFATFRKDGYTGVRPIPMDQLQELMQYDLFLNLDKLAEV